MIKGGYILQPRCFDKSNAAKMSPVTRELWFYLLRNVNHKDTKKSKRGSRFFSLGDIQEALCWYVGYRKMVYSKPQLSKALRRLGEGNNEGPMLATVKATRGIIITILNYNEYQDPKNYDGNGEGSTKAQRKDFRGHTINKNDKECKEVKKKIKRKKSTKKFIPPLQTEVESYFIEKGFSCELGKKAWEFYEAGDWVDSKGTPVKNWKQKMLGVWMKEENKIKNNNTAKANALGKHAQNFIDVGNAFINGD
jgi:hypothetical protein